MRYSRVYIDALGYELAPVVVTSEEIEMKLISLYELFHFQTGQLEALTGILERRWWEPNPSLSTCAATAAKKALDGADMDAKDLEVLIYAGVCRENLEPATACAVANGIRISNTTSVYDITNACLGILNGMIDIANRIELGQIQAGMVVSCETAREINEIMINKMLEKRELDFFLKSLATLTGGSGAVAVILSDGSFNDCSGHRLRGGVWRTAPEHNDLSVWGAKSGKNGELFPYIAMDSANLLKHGLNLFGKTWSDFLNEMEWTREGVDKIVCHQISSEHQKQILSELRMPKEKDLTTFEYLGNVGTVSLPITAALADEREQLKKGFHVGFLGVGSGLNTMMLGVDW